MRGGEGLPSPGLHNAAALRRLRNSPLVGVKKEAQTQAERRSERHLGKWGATNEREQRSDP